MLIEVNARVPWFGPILPSWLFLAAGSSLLQVFTHQGLGVVGRAGLIEAGGSRATGNVARAGFENRLAR